MLRKLLRTAPAALLAVGLIALPAAATTGSESAGPARLIDFLLAWLPDSPRPWIADSAHAVKAAEAGDEPKAGFPSDNGETQSVEGDSSEGEVHPSLDPNG